MPVFRVEKNSNYTTMCNYHLRDQGLSLKGKGLLSMLLSLPDTWNYSVRGLSSITPDGVDTTIELQNVGFSYGNHRILNHVNLTIPAKTTTAIVGPSGSGKTTLCSLITRFWDVDEGCIKLGGTDIREYKLDSLLSNISMVFQNVFLFADSIENNIKFGKPDATHEEVVRAAKSACCRSQQ